MGLCKCPKRKTTSHFCFHHCVNVCEHCIVNNHTICVVKSYTTWLKEASGSVSSSSISASALCAVCQKQFTLTPKEIENLSANFNDSKTAIRLLCYHIIHARCLSTYVKKQFKEGNILKCPSCARPLWLQQEQSQDSNEVLEVDSNELSPVALQLYKHLSDNGDWWGQAIIRNKNVEEIEKYLLEDEGSQKSEDESTLEIESQINGSDISPLTIAQNVQLPNNENAYYDNNNAAIVHAPSDVTTINYRNNTNQVYQPIHHRHFNNNYGIDTMNSPQLEQHQQCLSVNMTTITQGSDLSNRHPVTSSTLLLLNENNLSNDEEQLDPSGKYRPKKFNNHPWSLSYQRLLQHFCGTNKRSEENNTTKNAIIIIVCMLIIVILLLAITSYTRSNNEPFDTNSIDYGGDSDKSVDAVINLKSYNINNL